MLTAISLCTLTLGAPASPYFAIRVIDAETSRGVPLVELKTVHGTTYLTDSNGTVAFYEPGLMNKSVFLHIRSHGYLYRKDGFGYRGQSIRTVPNGSTTLKIHRTNIAQRLYRITGAGIYRDSTLLKQKIPIQQPLLNAQVFGSDSVVNAIYQGKIYWFWGDTNRPSYPLGNFHVPGATSLPPGQGGLDPNNGIDLQYFTDKNGFAKPTAQMPGKGPTWISSLVVLKEQKKERMFAQYVKVAKPMRIYERGIVEWNDKKKVFEKRKVLPLKAKIFPHGHPFHYRDQGKDYIYFANPYPDVRVTGTVESFLDLSQYEVWTCLKNSTTVDRDSKGQLRFAWRKDAPRLTLKLQKQLIAAKKIQPQEAALPLIDIETQKPVLAHSGSVYWNEYRKKWVMITVETFGRSFLGEVWYAEASTPTGPWTYARRIVTHDKYSFYNPKQHPMLSKKNGRILFFEGTYTHTFSGNAHPTPRYDYNQIMYSLDLSDERLILPVPIYPSSNGITTQPKGQLPQFYALDRPAQGAIPIHQNGSRLTIGKNQKGKLAFYAMPAMKEPPKGMAPLFEIRKGDRTHYTLKSGSPAQKPYCYVWPGRDYR